MADPAIAAPAASAPPSLWTKVTYGSGAIAFGIKDNGFSYFLLIFYSQVVGVDARLVGLAITSALMFDAFVDPIIGYWSDNFRSKWGRRHPFMYASVIPLAASYFLMWNPPEGWSQGALFWYIFGMAVVVRTFVSLYEIPSSSLAPELTGDYDHRSSLFAYRSYFGWTGGNAMSVVTFSLLFPAFATAAIPNGQFNPDAYAAYGIIGSVFMFAAILVSAIGTHSRIPYLKAPPPVRRLTPVKVFKEVFETLANRSFISLFVAATFQAIAGGLSAALAFYFLTYFWEFSPAQNGVITMGVFVSAVIGSVLAPMVSRKVGKKSGAIAIGLIAYLGAPLPIVLRLTGVLPDENTGFVFWFVFFTGMLDVGLIICFQVLLGSMMADLVEQSELKTGRRSEGLFFAALAFIRKMVAGLGIITATFVLTLSGLKAGADPSQVSPETIWRFGAIYVPTILSLWMAMIACIWFYDLDRKSHESNLRELEARNAAS
jgi:glycoside/pentoside/hexuronide:cation symporter, GPH family